MNKILLLMVLIVAPRAFACMTPEQVAFYMSQRDAFNCTVAIQDSTHKDVCVQANTVNKAVSEVSYIPSIGTPSLVDFAEGANAAIYIAGQLDGPTRLAKYEVYRLHGEVATDAPGFTYVKEITAMEKLAELNQKKSGSASAPAGEYSLQLNCKETK
jgi:hypothetical protein